MSQNQAVLQRSGNGHSLLEQQSLAEPLEASEPRPCSETGWPELCVLGSEASPRCGDPPAPLGPSVQPPQRWEPRARGAKEMMLGWEGAGESRQMYP